MKAGIFKELNKIDELNRIKNTDEYTFYQKHLLYLNDVQKVYHLNAIKDLSFKVIVSNLLIRILENKRILEDCIENFAATDKLHEEVQKRLENMRYFEKDNVKIYLPIFTQALNYIYINEPEKFASYPYNEFQKKYEASCLDFFDLYGYEIFDSSFTHLIKIAEDQTSCAFFHPDFQMIFIINDQGRFDLKIPLFDQGIKSKNYHHILRRVSNVAAKFYSNDRHKFLDALYKNKFISYKMYTKIYRSLSRRMNKKAKIVLKGKKADEVL